MNNNSSTHRSNIAEECALYRGVLARVAEELGVSRSYVSRAARGERDSPRIRKALERMLNRIRRKQSKMRRKKV